MKKLISAILVLALVLSGVALFASCKKQNKGFKIAVPNDATNEARALQLLEANGLIELKKDLQSDATPRDIVSNPYNIEIVEVEAAQIPARLADVDYAVINSNYAIEHGLTPFVTEGTDVSYPNIIAVKSGNENSDKIKALVAAVNSQAVKDYINATYKGAIVCDLGTVTDGTDSSVDYEALKGTTITIAASPVPHADILKIAKDVLAQKDITLKITEYNDYVVPNDVVESGEVDANYFQHVPYLEYFNAEHGTHLVSVLEVHHEPMGIYSSTYSDLSAVKK